MSLRRTFRGLWDSNPGLRCASGGPSGAPGTPIRAHKCSGGSQKVFRKATGELPKHLGPWKMVLSPRREHDFHN